MAVNPIRFSGLASGIDTDAMVKAMLGNQQLKIDRQKQQQTLLEWKRDAWKDMNSQINSFYKNFVDKMRLRGTFNKTAVTVSNSNALLIDKNVTIPEGNHTIEIQQMATRATVSTQTISKEGVDISKATRLCGDKIDDDGNIIKGLGIESGTKFEVTTNNGKKEIEISGEMTIADLEEALKKAVGDKVIAKFDAGLKGFIISSTETGGNQSITIASTAGDSNSSAALNLLGITAKTYSGDDAKILYNSGVTVISSTNNIEVNGLKFTITGETNEKITISSAKDTESMVSFIKEFVEGYNKLIEDINMKLNAQKSRKYTPLTDEQKESMKDSDIENWEKKIKESLFANDPQLKNVRDSLRSIMQDFDKNRDDFKSLSDIGITTGDWKELGKLHLDEEKLRAAINKNADAVVDLFAGKSADGKITVEGIGTKLNQSFQSMIKGITNVKSYESYYHDIVDREKLIDVNKQIDKLQDQYTRLENMYYAKFTAMEKAMSQLNSQSNWLAQQLGGM